MFQIFFDVSHKLFLISLSTLKAPLAISAGIQRETRKNILPYIIEDFKGKKYSKV